MKNQDSICHLHLPTTEWIGRQVKTRDTGGSHRHAGMARILSVGKTHAMARVAGHKEDVMLETKNIMPWWSRNPDLKAKEAELRIQNKAQEAKTEQTAEQAQPTPKMGSQTQEQQPSAGAQPQEAKPAAATPRPGDKEKARHAVALPPELESLLVSVDFSILAQTEGALECFLQKKTGVLDLCAQIATLKTDLDAMEELLSEYVGDMHRCLSPAIDPKRKSGADTGNKARQDPPMETRQEGLVQPELSGISVKRTKIERPVSRRSGPIIRSATHSELCSVLLKTFKDNKDRVVSASDLYRLAKNKQESSFVCHFLRRMVKLGRLHRLGRSRYTTAK